MGQDPDHIHRRIFKACPLCNMVWRGRAQMLSDQNVVLVGYQLNLTELNLGLIMFNHEKPGCGTTFGVEAQQFCDLYPGPIYRERLFGTEVCPGYCLDQDELKTCPQKCECAWVREVLEIIRNYPKEPGQ